MKKIFVSRQIRGKKRGKALGFPTINLEIPKSFSSTDDLVLQISRDVDNIRELAAK